MFEDSVSSIPTIWASMNSWFTPTVLFLLLNLMIATIFITSSLTGPKPNQNQNNHSHHHQQQHRLHPQLVRSPSVLQRFKSMNFYSFRSQEPTTHFQKSPAESEEHFEHFEQHQQQTHLAGSPSMLQKLKSINFYQYLAPAQSQNQNFTTPEPTHFDFEQEQHPKDESEHSGEEEEEEESRDHFDHEVHGVGDRSMDDVYSQLKNGGEAHVTRTNSDSKPSHGEAPAKLSKKMKKSASSKSAFGHFKEDDIVESRRPATMREGRAKAAETEEDEVDAKADDFINKFKQQLKLQRLDSIIRYKEMIGRGAGQ